MANVFTVTHQRALDVASLERRNRASDNMLRHTVTDRCFAFASKIEYLSQESHCGPSLTGGDE